MGCIELIEERNPAEPRPCTVEFNDGCTVDKKPRVPRPMSVEFRVGCIVDKKPRVPRPCTVELIVSLSPAVLRNPKVPRPMMVLLIAVPDCANTGESIVEKEDISPDILL